MTANREARPEYVKPMVVSSWQEDQLMGHGGKGWATPVSSTGCLPGDPFCKPKP